MIDKELKEYLDGMTETLMKGTETMLAQTKQEIFDKIDGKIIQSEARIAQNFATKEDLDKLETRVEALEI
jgi:hypothetical protein